jgi:tetratricopeptide (TPR) repeat protein
MNKELSVLGITMLILLFAITTSSVTAQNATTNASNASAPQPANQTAERGENVSGFQELKKSQILHDIGEIHARRREDATALEKFSDSLEISRNQNDQRGIAGTLHEIGNVYRRQGRDKEALENFEKSLHIKRLLKVRYDIAITELELGLLLGHRRQYDEALPFLLEADLLLKSLDCDSLVNRASAGLEDIRNAIMVTEYEKRTKEIIPEIIRSFPELNQLLK